MPELAAQATGGKVFMVTSLDKEHAGESVIDGRTGTFWITTGLFPQEIILQLGMPGMLSSIKVSCARVRHFRFEGCLEESPVNFKLLAEDELEDAPDRLQVWEHELGAQDKPTVFVRLIVLSGWDDFCSIHAVRVDGRVDGPTRPRPKRKGTGELNTDAMSVKIPPRSARQEKADGEPHAPRERADTSPWEEPSSPRLPPPSSPRRSRAHGIGDAVIGDN